MKKIFFYLKKKKKKKKKKLKIYLMKKMDIPLLINQVLVNGLIIKKIHLITYQLQD